ncbi:MAG: VWA domain-containing protein [Longimicrobiaceae bacterium]
MRMPRRLALLLLAAVLPGCGTRSEVFSGNGAGAPLPAPMPPPPVPVMAAPPPPPPVAGVPADSGFNTEEYKLIEENQFRDPALHPLSTFGIDVDPASYANVRRFLSEGRLPPRDAVRIEELVNYFDYDYPSPAGEHPFSVTTEVAPAPWNPVHRLVHVGLQGRRVALENMPPANLVFLLDVSGSMNSPDKLPLVKSALRMLVDGLREEDRVAIVVYAGAAGMVLPPTSGANRAAILDALERLEAGGSTAGGQGIRLAYSVAREGFRQGGNNRVILATDGDFNVGASSDAELVRLVEQERADGIALSVLGFGTGNLKDAKMEQLADRGNGNYAYIDNQLEARKVLVSEMGGTLLTIAKDVKVQVEFNPAEVKAYRLIGYENRLLAAEDFEDDTKDAGELGAGHSVTALYEVVPVGAPTPVRGTGPLRYQETRPGGRAAARGELLNVKLRYQPPQGGASRLIEQPVRDRPAAASPSADFRFAAAVAEWGLLLRDSRFRGDATHEQVLALARGALGEDRHGYRREFVRLVEDSRRIAAAASDRPQVGTR